MRLWWIGLLALAVLLGGCGGAGPVTPPVDGSGTLETRDYTLSGFTAVEMAISGRLIIEQARQPSASVRTDDNLFELLDLSVRDNRLVIGVQPGRSIGRTSEMTIRLGMDELTGVSLSGSGDVEVGGFEVSELTVALSGSGSIAFSPISADSVNLNISGQGVVIMTALTADSLTVDVSGSAQIAADGVLDSLEMNVTGAGTFDGAELLSQVVRLNISGSFDPFVNAMQALDVTISGTATVQVVGSPTLTTNISGTGEILDELGNPITP